MIAGLLFVAQTWLGALLSTATPADLQANPELQGSAYYTAVEDRIGNWLHWLLALAKGAGAAFSAMVGQGAGSRVIMDMAREGRLPSALARISGRSGVPVRSIIVTASGNVVVALWAATREDGLDVLSSIVNVGELTAFIGLHLSVIGYHLVRRRASVPGRWFAHGVVPVIGAVLLFLVLISASRLALLVGLVWLAIGLVLAALGHRGRGRPA